MSNTEEQKQPTEQKQPQSIGLNRDDMKALLREVLREAAEQDQEEVDALAMPVIATDAQPTKRQSEPVKIEPSASDDDPEPRFIIRSIGHDPEKGIRLETDWNDAFVKFLRSQGYTGTSDEQIVQKYVALVAKQVADRLTPNAKESNEFV